MRWIYAFLLCLWLSLASDAQAQLFPLMNSQAVAPASPPPAFLPSDLSGLVEWLDASNAGSITSSGGLVSQWNDLSGTGNNVTQASGSNQPTTGTTTQNGLNVIVNSATTGFDMPSGLYTIPAGDNTVFVVYQSSDTTNNRNILSGTNGTGRWRIALNNGGAGNFIGTNSATGVNSTLTGGNNTNVHVVELLRNGATATATLDSTVGTGAAATNTTPTALRLGSFATTFTTGLTGWMAEVVIYNRALNSTEEAQVKTYLKTKWNF